MHSSRITVYYSIDCNVLRYITVDHRLLYGGLRYIAGRITVHFVLREAQKERGTEIDRDTVREKQKRQREISHDPFVIST